MMHYYLLRLNIVIPVSLDHVKEKKLNIEEDFPTVIIPM